MLSRLFAAWTPGPVDRKSTTEGGLAGGAVPEINFDADPDDDASAEFVRKHSHDAGEDVPLDRTDILWKKLNPELTHRAMPRRPTIHDVSVYGRSQLKRGASRGVEISRDYRNRDSLDGSVLSESDGEEDDDTFLSSGDRGGRGHRRRRSSGAASQTSYRESGHSRRLSNSSLGSFSASPSTLSPSPQKTERSLARQASRQQYQQQMQAQRSVRHSASFRRGLSRSPSSSRRGLSRSPSSDRRTRPGRPPPPPRPSPQRQRSRRSQSPPQGRPRPPPRPRQQPPPPPRAKRGQPPPPPKKKPTRSPPAAPPPPPPRRVAPESQSAAAPFEQPSSWAAQHKGLTAPANTVYSAALHEHQQVLQQEHRERTQSISTELRKKPARRLLRKQSSSSPPNEDAVRHVLRRSSSAMDPSIHPRLPPRQRTLLRAASVDSSARRLKQQQQQEQQQQTNRTSTRSKPPPPPPRGPKGAGSAGARASSAPRRAVVRRRTSMVASANVLAREQKRQEQLNVAPETNNTGATTAPSLTRHEPISMLPTGEEDDMGGHEETKDTPAAENGIGNDSSADETLATRNALLEARAELESVKRQQASTMKNLVVEVLRSVADERNDESWNPGASDKDDDHDAEDGDVSNLGGANGDLSVLGPMELELGSDGDQFDVSSFAYQADISGPPIPDAEQLYRESEHARAWAQAAEEPSLDSEMYLPYSITRDAYTPVWQRVQPSPRVKTTPSTAHRWRKEKRRRQREQCKQAGLSQNHTPEGGDSVRSPYAASSAFGSRSLSVQRTYAGGRGKENGAGAKPPGSGVAMLSQREQSTKTGASSVGLSQSADNRRRFHRATSTTGAATAGVWSHLASGQLDDVVPRNTFGFVMEEERERLRRKPHSRASIRRTAEFERKRTQALQRGVRLLEGEFGSLARDTSKARRSPSPRARSDSHDDSDQPIPDLDANRLCGAFVLQQEAVMADSGGPPPAAADQGTGTSAQSELSKQQQEAQADAAAADSEHSVSDNESGGVNPLKLDAGKQLASMLQSPAQRALFRTLLEGNTAGAGDGDADEVLGIRIGGADIDDAGDRGATSTIVSSVTKVSESV